MWSETPPSEPNKPGKENIAGVVDASCSNRIAADRKTELLQVALEVEFEFVEAKRNSNRLSMLENIPKRSKIHQKLRGGARRAFDVWCAVTGLAILAPLLVIVAAAIKLEDGGPVLFSQMRVGKGLTKFRLLKFRSMVPNAGGNSFLTAPKDPRVTRVGRVLRKYKLDELPQLANIVMGDMQLVGVRPQVECFVAAFPAEYALLLQERPGITDLASLVFRNEEKMFQAGPLEKQYVSRMLPRKLLLALHYRKTRTFVSDLGILFAPYWVSNRQFRIGNSESDPFHRNDELDRIPPLL